MGVKKIVYCTVALLLLATFCFAQTPRNPSSHITGKSNFTSLGVGGLDVDDNPGFIEFMDDNGDLYYVWVAQTGKLVIASREAIQAYNASFPTGAWKGIPATVVGSQS